MNAKLIIYCKEKIQNYESLKQLCLLMNIEIILLNEQMTQNKVKDILNKKIKKTKKNNLEPAVVVFSNVASNIDVVKRKYNALFKSNCYSNKL